MNENAIDDASRQSAISDRGGAVAGFSWERWQEKIERLCRLGEMCADDESTLKTFERRVGCEGGQARRGDGGSLLAERAVLAGVSAEEVWRRRSSVSLGGACRMMFSADGVVAVNLPRDYDWQMLPALFGMLGLDDVGLRLDEFWWDEVGRDEVGVEKAASALETAWQTLESAVARLPTEDLVCAAGELGLAVAEVGCSGSGSLPPLPQTGRSLRDAKVVDLSVMWAGPLCGDLLARAGAQVVKVESPGRPDGARLGLPEFYELLNGKKQHRSIGFDASEGRAELLGLLQNADIVITSCRPRALEQMGIDPHDLVSQSDVIWAAITGYGWEQGSQGSFRRRCRSRRRIGLSCENIAVFYWRCFGRPSDGGDGCCCCDGAVAERKLQDFLTFPWLIQRRFSARRIRWGFSFSTPRRSAEQERGQLQDVLLAGGRVAWMSSPRDASERSVVLSYCLSSPRG